MSIIHSSLPDISVCPGNTAFKDLQVQYMLVFSMLVFLSIQLYISSVLKIRCSATES